jgi:hypothetical protein
VSTVSDPDFIRAFEDRTLPGEGFHHRDHIRLAWLYLGTGDEAGAERLMEEGIRRYAAHLGAPQKYHHTITLFWMRAVSVARRETPTLETFDAFAEAHPELLDKALVERHYTSSLLESAAARSGWVDPDRLPLDRRATIEA